MNYLEFCAAFYSDEHEVFTPERTRPRSLTLHPIVQDMVSELMLQLHTTFYENKIGLRRAFRYFDVDEACPTLELMLNNLNIPAS